MLDIATFRETPDLVRQAIRNRGLDEALVELPRLPAVFRPEFLPDLVALVIIALVELLDARQVERLVVRAVGRGCGGRAFGCHRGVVSSTAV